MNAVPKLIAALEQEGIEVWVEGGASNDQVMALERALGVSMPPSYVSFLTSYGAIGIGDSFVSGIIDGDALSQAGSSTFGDTLQFRAHSAFPPGLLVIGKHEDGAYCLDTNRQSGDGEYAVVNFEFGSIQHRTPVSPSFADWLIRFQLRGSNDGSSPNTSLEHRRGR